MPARPFGLAVKAVLRDEAGRSLLIRRSPANMDSVGAWEWPGGKCDPGEPFDQALLREVHEETGLIVELVALAGATEFDMPKVCVVLLCLEAHVLGGALALSDEHDRFEWVPFSEFGRRRLPAHVARFMLDYADRQARGERPALAGGF